MGVALKDKGDLKAAIDSYKQALKIKPDYAEAQDNLYPLLLDPDDMTPSIKCMLEFLKKLEIMSSDIKLEDKVLWDDTPIDTKKIQDHIERLFTGVSDFDRDNEKSRPFGVLKAIKELVTSNQIPPNFTLLDIACGDGIIIDFIKTHFPDATIVGLDPNKNKFDYHQVAQKNGVILVNSYIQNLIENDVPEKIDVITMFNTCRAWEHSQRRSVRQVGGKIQRVQHVREGEHNLPTLCEEWIFRNSKFALLTLNLNQIRGLNKDKLEVSVLNYFIETGRGNDPNNGSFVRIKNKQYD